ncbi:hypothetical protein OKW30_001194 [Paraburkholderia sp. Clong3]|uniref:hypothetical protein n=1 Tax=Paraburkholderia sp. Clong3 TaxID=2991061 RepID=UPI003D1BB0B4
MIMRDRFVSSLLLVVISGAAQLSQAQDSTVPQTAAQQAAALKLIVDAAGQICQQAPLEEKNNQVTLSANADAKVTGLLKKVLGVDAGVAASSTKGGSSGVLQKDLATAIKNGNDCKASVLTTLVPVMLPNFRKPPEGAPPAGAFTSISEVTTANGSFKRQGDKWIEYPPYAPGSYFTFNEVSRDPNQIILSDPSRQKPGDVNNPMLVRLPTHGGAVQWSYTNPVVWMDFTFAQPALH